MIILIISSSGPAFSQVTRLEKGQVAPYTGALIGPERLDKLVKAEKKVIVLQDLRLTQDELIEYHRDSSRRYRKELSEQKFNSFLTNTGYFVLGVFITGFAFKSAEKIRGM